MCERWSRDLGNYAVFQDVGQVTDIENLTTDRTNASIQKPPHGSLSMFLPHSLYVYVIRVLRRAPRVGKCLVSGNMT